MDRAVLRNLIDGRGPFASVYLDATHDTEDSGKEIDLRWRALRKRLAEQDAGEPTLTALDEAIRERPPAIGRAGRLLIATGDRVLVDEYLTDPPPAPVARVSPLPYLVPLVIAGPRCVPHVVVLVDKVGADLRAVDGAGTTVAAYTVEGRDHPVHKVRGAGWSHRTVQAHADATVTHNIDQVAGETAQLVERTKARLLVLAGDIEPRTLLRRALPDSCAKIAAEVDTGRRAEGSDRDAFERDVRELVAEQWRLEHGKRLERFRAELGRGAGRAVQGLGPTTEALRQANVELLVIDDPAFGDKTVWAGQRPQLVAVEEAELSSMGATEGAPGRADEVLPAAAIAVGADLLAETPELGDPVPLTDGVGALLRHD
ncbi:MAG TPA: hypothetical protein VGX25_25490 [Actinophytocola sp.]|uniref:Rv2629 family ribosome hibernation factor n=1 Tax=Actinophytocola sp. TaxID=1872138 RepID=UPI002DDD3910|nr:hypothetical protein [Actinophytocola sp.]HEV2782760.1 hypothetical protein [Actinophytocola sp.]